MTFVLDVSAIVNLVRITSINAVELARGCYTVDLAYYELGNVLWKYAKRGLNTAPILRAFEELLNVLRVERVKLNSNVLNLAIENDLTYYDAVYVYLAIKLGTKLVTEDGELLRKFPRMTLRVEDMVRGKT